MERIKVQIKFNENEYELSSKIAFNKPFGIKK